MLLGQIGEDGVETGGVIGAQIGRRQHAGQQDGAAPLLQAGEDGIKAGLGGGGVEAAQRIIGAQLDDDNIGIVGQHPIEPGEAAGHGVAGDAAIDDRGVDAGPLQRPAELGREPIVGRQSIAGGQAIAEGQDLQGPAARRGKRRRGKMKQQRAERRVDQSRS